MSETTVTAKIGGQPVKVLTADYKGRVFPHLYVSKSTFGDGPGWFIYGSTHAGRGGVHALVARPDVKARKHPGWNVARAAGWRTKRDAVAVLKGVQRVLSRHGARKTK